ncbi:hypothetical protein BSU01_24245 [Erwinia billingiae]|nr:hypothetical protein [Erwinia billingiae]
MGCEEVNVEKYIQIHRALAARFDSIMPMLTQVMSAEYHDREVFVNNYSLLFSLHQEAALSLKDDEFDAWLRAHDPDLRMNILATGIGIRIFENLLNNYARK